MDAWRKRCMLGRSVLRYPAPAAPIRDAAALELLGVVIMGWGADAAKHTETERQDDTGRQVRVVRLTGDVTGGQTGGQTDSKQTCMRR